MRQDPDRARRYTADSVLRRIDERTRANLMLYATAETAQIDARLEALDREWDTDRAIEAEAATTALTGIALSVLVHRAFIAVPGFVAAAVLVHAVSGWHPLLPLLRRLGVRTAREIARERYALKAIRGDFEDLELTAHLLEASRSAHIDERLLRASPRNGVAGVSFGSEARSHN